jgi:hypothetical protein
MALTLCLLACPVMEKPEPMDMRGTLMVAPAFVSWTMRRVIAMDSTGAVVGETAPVFNNTNYVWTMKAVAEDSTPGVFWIEMIDRTGRMFYSEGTDVRFVPDWTYDLPVTEHYIPVGSASDLAKIGNNALFPRDGKYTLIRNIRLSGIWRPLCDSRATAFSGIFDGHNYTISALVLSGNSDLQNIGLFGCIVGRNAYPLETRIGNLNLEVANSELRVSSVNELGIGALAGYVENAVIDKVAVNGPVGGVTIIKSGGGDFYAGGLVGKISGENSLISRSAATFSIVVRAESAGSGYLGGIAGYCESMGGTGILGATKRVIIEKAYSTGLIALSKTGGNAYAGGLIGYYQTAPSATINAVIAECYASGNVSVYSDNADTLAAGGLVGGSDTDATPGLTIERSCALMEAITAEPAATTLSAGGLSGYRLAPLILPAGTFQLASVLIKPSSVPPAVDADDTVERSVLDGTWFGSAPLMWDLNDTWQWDVDMGRLKFRWQ